jgi:hypothetical protein
MLMVFSTDFQISSKFWIVQFRKFFPKPKYDLKYDYFMSKCQHKPLKIIAELGRRFQFQF